MINFLSSDEKFDKQDRFIVRRVVFIGNEKTKNEIIARELNFSVGSEFDTSKIEYNENRVYGTGLFNRVKIWFEKDSTGSDSVDVYVWVNERWYIWLFPIFGWRDRDLKKLYYGAGFLHSNFRGKNEKLILSFALGYDPWVWVKYLNPWILGSKHWFYSIKAYYQRVRSRSRILVEESDSFYYEDNFVFNFLFGKRFGLYKKLWASIGFRNIKVTGDFVGLKTISQSGNDKVLIFGSGYRYDTRDIPAYPNVGVLFNFAFKFNQLLNHNASFIQSAVEFQGYQKAWAGLLVGRFFILNSFGRKIPVYSHYYFGYEERLRGYFNEIFEGENIFGGTVEYRFPIVKQRFFKWEKMPLKEFSILKFGVDFVIFGDIGRTWFNNEKVFKLNYWKGYGVGLNFILPYDLILSVEFAKNNTGRGQVILDFRGSFD